MSQMRRIDLNSDLGEGFGPWSMGDDAAMMDVATSANVACGGHAGDPETMFVTLSFAAQRGVVVGAHPGYADREGFGRRPMDVAHDRLADWVAVQIATLTEIATAAGTTVRYVKPHGALYNRVVDDASQAAAVLAGSARLPVVGLPGSVLLDLAERAARTVVPEGFPDRGYTAAGRLVPRGEPGALITAAGEVAANAVALAGHRDVRTVCVHGDSPGAVEAALAVRAALEGAGYLIRPWIE